MKIVVLDGYTENPGDLSWSGLEQLGTLTVYDRTPADQAAERIGGAEAVYTNKAPITRETLDACPNVRFIGVLATGYNVIDVAAAKEKGIPVCNIPTYGTPWPSLPLRFCLNCAIILVRIPTASSGTTGRTTPTGASGTTPWSSLRAKRWESSASAESGAEPERSRRPPA